MQDLQANIQTLRAASVAAATDVGRVSAAMSGVASQAQVAAGGIRTATSATRQSTVAAKEAGDSFNEFGRQVGLSARRFVAFSVAAGGMYAVTRAIREGVAEAVNFDLQLNRLRQVSGETAGQVRVVGDEVMRLSTNLGASSKDLMEAAVTLKQAGLATSDVKKALEGISQASLAPNFSSMKQITEGAIAAFQQFGKNADQLKEQLGAMNAVAGDFAVEASDLVTVVQKAGGTAAQTGAQFNELLAVFTSVRSTTRESADSIATGLRTIFTRIQRNDTVEALKSLGVNLRYAKAEADALGDSKLEGQFVGMYEAVRRLSEGLSKIRTTDPRFSSAIEELGGYRQVSRVIPMLQQFGEAQKALNVARLGSASLEAAAATRQEALATKFAKTKESFQQLVNELVQTRGFKNMVDVALTLANAFIEVTGALKPLLPLIATLGAIKVGAGLFSFGKGVRDAFTAPVGSSFAPPPVQRSRFRFATGDFVPGHGNGDTVDAKLTPGEFVIRKEAARRLGAHSLKHMNQTGELPRGYNRGGPVLRYAEGGDVDPDELTPAQLAKLRQQRAERERETTEEKAFIEQRERAATVGKRERTKSGGGRPDKAAEVSDEVVSHKNVNKLLKEFQQKTSVDYSSLFSKLVINDTGVDEADRAGVEALQRSRGRVDKAGNVIFPRGGHNRRTGVLGLNKSLIKDEATLREVLAHELGHAVDYRLGGGTAASDAPGVAKDIAESFGPALRASDTKAGYSVKDPKFAAYRYSPKELFAEAHAAHLTGKAEDPRLAQLLGQISPPRTAGTGQVSHEQLNSSPPSAKFRSSPTTTVRRRPSVCSNKRGWVTSQPTRRSWKSTSRERLRTEPRLLRPETSGSASAVASPRSRRGCDWGTRAGAAVTGRRWWTRWPPVRPSATTTRSTRRSGGWLASIRPRACTPRPSGWDGRKSWSAWRWSGEN